MNYVALLKEKNLKVTPQRLTIVEELYIKGHLNIDEIYLSLQNRFPSISLATIYKNINTMIDISFLNEVKIPQQKSVYELTKKEHSHVVCSRCNQIVDIELDILAIYNQASALTNYTLHTNHIVFNGVCPNCK